MKPFGITALVFAITGIFIPVVGPFISGLSGFLAWLSAGKGTTLGISAIIINIINILFLSPSLILAGSDKNPLTGTAYKNQAMLDRANEVQTIFGTLLLIQVAALVIFLVVWLMGKNKRARQYAD
ncbi:MAG TPA: hypothetical protein PLE99_05790 [Candidatus Thiothrix moscowensis]|uniref:hypothetical protein n=1 Tax=unclassified Thiothrix TaxID=2636184 RepID=UPI0025F25CE0|nr:MULTISPECIES: hypothetical protein [unclassified Thiothrix]HRJ52256.1 hypothetical protein [Candidatus Thiothrix moscowensis]HRJ92571.1 hypothetical protein [Candidatus Thiothrix moscowensis]